jgi:hypothetical protein
MSRTISVLTVQLDLVTVVVRDYDDSESVGDDGRPKRWVVVRPADGGTGLLLARASTESQRQAGVTR